MGNTSLIRIKSSNKQAFRIADKTVLCYDIHGFRKRQHPKLAFYTILRQSVAENTVLVSQNAWWTWSQRTPQVAQLPLQLSDEGMVHHGRALLGANPVLPSPTNGLVSIIQKLRHHFDQHTDLQMQELRPHVKQKRPVFHLGTGSTNKLRLPSTLNFHINFWLNGEFREKRRIESHT